MSLKVTKRNVEQFAIGDNLILGRTQAQELHAALGEALGLPYFTRQGCDDHYSHGAHWHGKNGTLYCGGLSFDRT